jgi:predicted deacetylase
VAAAGSLVIAIHDVAPSLAREVRYLLDALDRLEVRPRVLKVIPNQDGTDDIRDYPEFVRMLAGEVAAGSEVVLHGYTHRVAGPLQGRGFTQLRARLFAGDAAEFVTLDDAQMLERLVAGREILRASGFDPIGFCAPGWLALPQLPQLLKRSGFHYNLSMLTLQDVTTGRRLWTPWRGCMGAGALQERLVGLGAGVLAATAPFAPVMKVFLHPQGAPESADCARILQTIAQLARTRRPVTYGRLIARHT